MKTLVEMKGVRKEFPGVIALQDISFDIRAGEVHILLGENGAGKSTLMKILSGVYEPTAGSITVGTKTFSKLSPKDSFESGISIIYQELSVINELSIEENLFVGKLPSKKAMGLFEVVDYKYMRERAEELCAKVGLKRDPTTLVEELSISEKQQVEIAKALAYNAQVIIMDEPTASLTLEETNHLFSVIRQLKSEGKGIVYISHKMKEIKEIGDRVTVLKDGTYVGTREVAGVEVDDLISMMVGRKVQTKYNEQQIDFDKQPVIFEVKNIRRADNKVKGVSFKLRKGEILGFSGLVGSGRSEMMNAIFGAEPKSGGEVLIGGRPARIKNPYSAIKHGLAMVTENRRETGFINTMDIKQNISLLPYIKTSKGQGLIGMVSGKYDKECAEEQKKNLRIKCFGVEQNITELSGGNQQKVILGKWLAADSQVIIFDEPTKGIDIGSKGEIYALMRRLAEEGKGVLMVSSELPELLSVCDTIAVFREGEIATTIPAHEATEEAIVRASTGENTGGTN